MDQSLVKSEGGVGPVLSVILNTEVNTGFDISTEARRPRPV